jgi:hypothetical protein
MPVVRGESGLDAPDRQSATVLGLERDVTGVWFHNFVWAGLHSGALYEIYWWSDHLAGLDFDHRQEYQRYRTFLRDIPLSGGGFVDWGGEVSDPWLRVVGQRHPGRGTAHLWVQNRRHTWKSVIDGSPIPPTSGNVTLRGFEAGVYRLEWFDTWTGHVSFDNVVRVEAEGRILIPIRQLVADVAVKIRKIEE